MKYPAIDSVWLTVGAFRPYRVLYMGTLAPTGEPIVVYQETGDNVPLHVDRVWCRPLSSWYENFEEVVKK